MNVEAEWQVLLARILKIIPENMNSILEMTITIDQKEQGYDQLYA